MENQTYDDLRPYRDEEIPAAMQRIATHPYFRALAAYLYPEVAVEKLQEQFRIFRTVNQFQLEVMDKAIKTIVARSTHGFSCPGLECLDPKRRALCVAHHRDRGLGSAG